MDHQRGENVAKKKTAAKKKRRGIWRESRLSNAEREAFLERLDKHRGDIHKTLADFRIKKRNWAYEFDRDRDPDGVKPNEFGKAVTDILLSYGKGLKGFEREEERAKYDHKLSRNDLMITLKSIGVDEKFAQLFMALDPFNPKDQVTLTRLFQVYANLQYREQRVETEDTTKRDVSSMTPEQLLARMSKIQEIFAAEQAKLESARMANLQLREANHDNVLLDVPVKILEAHFEKKKADTPPDSEAASA